MSSWYLNNDNEIVQDDFPEPIAYLTPPYPASLWRLDSDDDLVTLLLPEPLANFTPPYPASMWYLDENNKLMNALLPDEPGGAFTGCTSLAYISIPESVQYIGDLAFRGTALTRVRISRTCEFSETSFPEGCVISYYGDEEEATDVQAQLATLAARVTALENNS